MTSSPDPMPPAPLGRNQPAEEAAPLLEVLLEHSDDAVIRKTLDNVIVAWSRGAERMYGYTSAEIVGTPVTRLMPPERRGEATDILGVVARGGRVDHMETVRLTRDGRLLTVVLTASPVRDAAGTVVGCVTQTRDITAYRQAQEALRRLEAESQGRALVLETASRVALDILASRSGVDALRHIAEAARRLSGARYAALGVANPDGKGLTEFVTVGLTPGEEAAIGPRPKGRGVLGLLLHRAEPLRIDSLKDDPASVEFPPNHPPMKTFLGVPIRRGETVLGSLYLTDKESGGAFTEADEVAVQALGAHAAVAVHNLQMLSRQRALVRGLITAQEEERRAVAYDLHDGLTQFVMAAHAHLESFRRAQAAGKVERADRELDRGLRYLQEAVLESRRLVNGLRSLALDDLGLAGAVEQLLQEEKARAGWADAEMAHNIAGQRFDVSLETAAYRVAQEALTNARKHSRTDRVRVLLIAGQDACSLAPQITLEVQDWGCGFVPEEKAAETERVGLHSMAERVHLTGGAYRLRSAPGEGTTVKAVFPALPPLPDVPENGVLEKDVLENGGDR